MADNQAVFRPDYAPSPGELLEEQLDSLNISAREFSRRCGRSAKLITEILSGKAALEPETALQFERVLDIEANIWLRMEAEYRLSLARKEDTTRLSADIQWARSFPLTELQRRGAIEAPQDGADAVKKLLQFFGLASAAACREHFSALALSYRHSPSFRSEQNALFAWLRLGELEAAKISTKDYDRAAFVKALHAIRALTTSPVEEFYPRMVNLCAAAGVAFIVLPPLDGLALSGISRWLTPRKALIQQTLRHMVDDHFWFTFFHEAAHLLFHSRKSVFVDGQKIATSNSPEEDEANKWAASFLVPQVDLETFVAGGIFNQQSVRRFGTEIGIAPGIVVGQLQKRNVIPYSHLNKLKRKFQWTAV
ncbi:HigA family addiction module antitoxin [Bradyrhizobium sp.]|uniref:HigA family addiction module antitoxin n=1 Tax=Bradyrhizobium sp. TaxID=376 RepID=UPI003C710C95